MATSRGLKIYCGHTDGLKISSGHTRGIVTSHDIISVVATFGALWLYMLKMCHVWAGGRNQYHLSLHCKAALSLWNMWFCLLGVKWVMPNTTMELLLSSWKCIDNWGRKEFWRRTIPACIWSSCLFITPFSSLESFDMNKSKHITKSHYSPTNTIGKYEILYT